MVRLLPLAALLALALPARAADVPPQSEFINSLISAKWAEADIKRPAARAGDEAFLRRAFLDLVGRVATPAEFEDFELDRSRDKRVRLVKRLLHSTSYTPHSLTPPKRGEKPPAFNYADEFAGHWAGVWTNWLMGRTVHGQYREQVREWLKAEMLAGDFDHKRMVEKLLTASGQDQRERRGQLRRPATRRRDAQGPPGPTRQVRRGPGHQPRHPAVPGPANAVHAVPRPPDE